MEPRGRAKARGRARSIPQTQGPPQQQARRPGETTQRPQQGPPPGFQQQQPQTHVPLSGGRASHRGSGQMGETLSLAQKLGGMSLGAGAASGDGDKGAGGNGAQQLGRGSLRGRRQINIDTIRTRPAELESKKGKSGSPILLNANYFQLITKTDWCLYQYRVDFAPEEDNTYMKKNLLRPHRITIGGEYLFDGTVLYTCNRLAPDPMELFSTRETDGENIRITIKLVGDLVFGDYHYLQFYNILTRKCLQHLKLQLVGRDYFDAKNKVDHGDLNLEIWPGYLTSIRQHDPHILMCAEITHKIMRQDTVFKIYMDITQENPRDFKSTFQSAIVGSTVLTDYNNRTYRIDDVDFDATPKSTFKMKNGREISYAVYMKEKYNIKIRNESQPMLVSKSKPRDIRAGQTELVYLIPELCRMTGISESMRSDFHLMRAIADRTRIGPRDRVERLLSLSKRFLEEPKIVQELRAWNMKLSENLVEFSGRILPSEEILLGGNQKTQSGDKVDWTGSLRSNPMFIMHELKKWVIMYPSRIERDIETFVTQLIKVGQGMRFAISQPKFVSMRDDRIGTYVQELEHVIGELSPLFIVCVVSNNNAERYGAIKKKCCVDRAVPTQVVVQKNASGRNMSVTTKIAIQINAKIGGAPWAVNIPLKGLMVVGFDVCHDSKQKGKSFGAMVASLDNAFSRYYSCVSAHTCGEELSNDLSINIAKAVKKYQSFNKENAFPARILIYRDGVGEGQIPYVYEHELAAIKTRLMELYGGELPKLGFIIVTKRINTRIFYKRDNPPPGTVVDDCITMPERYDFFLISQSVRQGTVAPTSYNVIHDTLGLDPDKIQRLTYKMCHLYYNWSGTVRVPAPCQYAHKLAYLVGQNLHRSPSTALDSLLYFL